MSIARVTSILGTDFTDFTFNTYNYTWPILEYGVAILVCCGPLLRPLFPQILPFSIKSRLKGNKDISGNESLQRPGHSGFSQLNEGAIPLQSRGAPTSVTTISTNAPRENRIGRFEHRLSHESELNALPRGAKPPSNVIAVQTRWDVGSM